VLMKSPPPGDRGATSSRTKNQDIHADSANRAHRHRRLSREPLDRSRSPSQRRSSPPPTVGSVLPHGSAPKKP
jgi:hypothetical protein